MLLKLIVRISQLSFLLGLLLCPKLTFADVIYARDNKYFGFITSISETGVNVTQACDEAASVTVEWDTIKSVVFTGTCTETKAGPIVFGTGSNRNCSQEVAVVFLVKFKTEGSGLLAAAVTMESDRTLQIRKYQSAEVVRGPVESVAGIKRAKVCPDLPAVVNMIKNGTMPSNFKIQQ